MTDEVILLYMKERLYQVKLFGEYSENPSFNVSSFLIFLKDYIDRAIDSYSKNWTGSLPSWATTMREYREQGTAPVKTYENLIKIMALAGAAIEAYVQVDVDEWRREGPNQKWFEEGGKNDRQSLRDVEESPSIKRKRAVTNRSTNRGARRYGRRIRRGCGNRQRTTRKTKGKYCRTTYN